MPMLSSCGMCSLFSVSMVCFIQLLRKMQQHFGEVQKLIKLGKKSDSCAKHFATQFSDASPSPKTQGEGIICSIIWQGNPISAAKTFATKKLHPTHNFLLVSTQIMKSVVPADRP